MSRTLCLLSLLCASTLMANDATPTNLPDGSGPNNGGNAGWKIYESGAQSIADTRDAAETQRRQTQDGTAAAGFC
jgi:hypothetical protein